MRRGLFLPKPSLLCLVPDAERPQLVQRSCRRDFITHQGAHPASTQGAGPGGGGGGGEGKKLA